LLNAILQQPLTLLASLRPDVDPGLAAIVERALARDPRVRFATADEMRRALAPWTGAGLQTPAPMGPSPVMITPPGQMVGVDPRGATVGVSTPAVATRPPSGSSPLLWVAIGLGVLFLLGAGIGVAYYANRPTDPGGVWVMNDKSAKTTPAATATAT